MDDEGDLFPDMKPDGIGEWKPKHHVRSEGPDTSAEAAYSAEELAENHMRIIYEQLVIHPQGKTVQEIETELFGTEEALSQQQVCRRMIDLTRAKYIHDTGERRKNRSGRKAIVWRTGPPSIVLVNQNQEEKTNGQ